jgi:hypothetical protein
VGVPGRWKDDSSSADAAELSGWTRSYANYLEEYVINVFDIPIISPAGGGGGGGGGGGRDGGGGGGGGGGAAPTVGRCRLTLSNSC